MNYGKEPRLLGGSAADWSVLAGGILLAALFAAVFFLVDGPPQLKSKQYQS